MTMLTIWLTLATGLGQDFGALPETEPEPRSVSGVYPHLALFNDENECGTGAVIEWAGRLWAITYAPHKPRGSSDKLYSIHGNYQLEVHPESIGGTPACRMIHPETQQLVLGPYIIDKRGDVRVIPSDQMPGRLTGVARHLDEPARKVYFATMEEGLYEVDLETLEVVELFADDQGQLNRSGAAPDKVADLPGYHGKGLYSGQGRVVYANNGEPSSDAQRRPDVASGCLAEWDGQSWRVVRRNQFTEVTGPGSVWGNADAAGDPLWSIGWDHRSLILMLLDAGTWSAFRLPKASHAYDGAHGWNTEWPRIRDVGLPDMLMTMHGSFWSFPRGFSAASNAGIKPLSTYLRVVGDVAPFRDRLVLGCDDTARSEFLNTRRAKGELAGPGQSHSNLWFLQPWQLKSFGRAFGQGAVWLDEAVAADTWSDPFLFEGFLYRAVHLTHDAGEPVTFRFEVDPFGDGQWVPGGQTTVPAEGYAWHAFDVGTQGSWIRVSVDRDVAQTSVAFHYSNQERRIARSDRRFAGLAQASDEGQLGGFLRVRGDNLRTLALASTSSSEDGPRSTGFFELDETLTLHRRDDPEALAWQVEHAAVPTGVLSIEPASVLYVDDDGERWRLPKRPKPEAAAPRLGPQRVCREVVTERDLFHADGTFYELPARNAGGFAKLRPIASHEFQIHDYASYRGMLVLTGLAADAPVGPHIVRSTDNSAAVWLGVVDDLWALGRAVGVGGPWLNDEVRAGEVSDPYLLTGYESKEYKLSHDSTEPVSFELQVDISGTGNWQSWLTREVAPHATVHGSFPVAFQAYWLRTKVNQDCRATVQLSYK